MMIQRKQYRLPVWILLLICLPVRADFKQDYRAVEEVFATRDKKAQERLDLYMQDYPYSPYADEVKMMQAVLLTEKEKYKRADKLFATVDANALSRQGENTYRFYWGYTLIELQRYKDALKQLLPLKQKANSYQTSAKYYIGYCYYCTGDYARALVEFRDMERIGAYMDVVPYFILQIDYAQKRYNDVMDRAQGLLKRYPNNEHNAELHRMCGEIYFRQGDYASAAQSLSNAQKIWKEQKTDMLRSDLYMLGISLYKLEQYAKAVSSLKSVTNAQDSISESTCLHLGHCYLQMGDEEKAKMSYLAATRYQINDTLREEAMFNYVQIAYHQGSALGENIRAFRDFMDQYPNTSHKREVHAILADLLMTSKDFVGAYQTLEAIPNPEKKMRETMQYLRYQIGTDAFLQNKYTDAMTWLTQVVVNEPKTSVYKTEAFYLNAEIYYRQHNYEQCIKEMEKYEKQANAAKSINRVNAYYLKAYAYFNSKAFAKAEQIFRTYCENVSSSHRTYWDAQNRIGDCRFSNRQFKDAIAAYQISAAKQVAGSDYALYQIAYSYGLLHDYQQKVLTLADLMKRFPKSNYAPIAYYEQARALLQMDRNEQAIVAYEELLRLYPRAAIAPKAALEMAMAHRALQHYDAAIAAYKTTVERYSGTEEAYLALDGLEQICVETNRLNEYLQFSKSLARYHMHTVTREDSLVYATAEVQYLKGNYEQAAKGLQTYIDQYCTDSRYCVDATYYLANSLYKSGKDDEALAHYEALALQSNHGYVEEACLRTAELYFNRRQYLQAEEYFEKVIPIASSNPIRTTARLGVLRCRKLLQDQSAIVEAASELLNEPQLPDSVQHEARFARALALAATSQNELAIRDFTMLVGEVRTSMGAQSKYQLAQCYFNIGNLDTAEEQIMDFTQKPTTQQYWLARSLILLSDIYVQRQDLFQAKQYLLALQTNYHQQDDIASIVEQRLEQIALQEQNASAAIDSEEN